MKKTLLVIVLSILLIVSLTGCGKADKNENGVPAAEQQNAADAEAPAENDGQNPVMNVAGVYHAEGCLEALVECEGTEDAKITVTYAPSPWFHDVTVMSGRFDPETLTVEFTNAVLTEYVYNSDGSVDEEKPGYTDGTGRAVFSIEDNTMTVTEETSSGDLETVYTFGPSGELMTVTDPDHYAGVTAMDKREVETVVGFAVRTAYLSENWYAIADMIRYPITINGTELSDSVAFIEYMQDKTVSETDRQAMYDEDFLDMFVNYQGICMGDGEVWLSDPNYMTDEEPVLEIIAINGITDR